MEINRIKNNKKASFFKKISFCLPEAYWFILVYFINYLFNNTLIITKWAHKQEIKKYFLSLCMDFLVIFHKGLVQGLVRLAMIIWKNLQIKPILYNLYLGIAIFLSLPLGIIYFWVWLASTETDLVFDFYKSLGSWLIFII